MKTFKRADRKRRGAALVEYGLIVAGVALVAAAAVSIFGSKTSGMLGSAAAILPGAQATDNAPIMSGRLIETTDGDGESPIEVDAQAILDNSGTNRLGNNLGLDIDDLVVDGSGGD